MMEKVDIYVSDHKLITNHRTIDHQSQNYSSLNK